MNPTAGARFPWVSGSVGSSSNPQYAMPPTSYPPVRGIPTTPPIGAMNTNKRPLPVPSSQLVGDVRTQGPPRKVPRYTNVTTPIAKDPGPVFGRQLTPSYIMNQVSNNIRQDINKIRPADKARIHTGITRTVNTDKGQYSYALFLRNQVVFLDLLDTRDPSQGQVGGRAPKNYTIGGIWRISIPKEIISLFSLPVLNYVLRINDTIENPGTAEESWLDAKDVLSRFRFDGIVRTDANTESSHPAYRTAKTKHYTVTVDGWDPDATNIWGRVKNRQTVYLIVKRIEPQFAPDHYFIAPGDGQYAAPVTTDEIAYHPQPIQVIPWADYNKGAPGPDELRYYDTLSQSECMGVAINVGWIRQESDASAHRKLSDAWFDASALMDLPKCGINVLGYRSDVPV